MPNSGFDIQFYAPRNGAPKPHFDKFEDGVEKAYGYLKDPSHSDFALAVGPSQRDAPVPTLMLERMPEVGVLVQLYVPEDLSLEGKTAGTTWSSRRISNMSASRTFPPFTRSRTERTWCGRG
jgi:hypothetical protein